MLRLVTASVVTLSLMIMMTAGVVIAAMVAADQLNLIAAMGIVVLLNLVLWLISPWLTDLSLRWMNKMTFIEDSEVARRYPHVHKLIHEVADSYGFRAPSIGIIADRNPTAFTYGRGRASARIIITEGIFEFLSEDETKAVIAHELGHIVNRDFVVMTVAGILVQILYQVYVVAIRSKSDKKNNAAVIGLAALIFYWIGEYLLLYLSRAREYMADAFSASLVEPRHLASALVKVAYGIAVVDDSEASGHLLRSTRHMGLIDANNARATGVLAGVAGPDASVSTEPAAAASGVREIAIPPEAMLFDVYNPWAKLSEISSTHPLTGKRILALETIAKARGLGFNIDIASAADRAGIGHAGLWGHFLREAAIYYAPLLAAVIVALAGYWPLAPAALAIGILLTMPLRFPRSQEKPATVMQLMSDPSVSPVFGRPVRLEGMAIGRANPGFALGEDVMFRDKTGLVTVDFRSMGGFIGDLIAGWMRVKPHIGQRGTVDGWFRRDLMGYVVLKEMRTPAGRLGCVPWFWQAVLCILVLVATVGVLASTGLGIAYRPLHADIGSAVRMIIAS